MSTMRTLLALFFISTLAATGCSKSSTSQASSESSSNSSSAFSRSLSSPSRSSSPSSRESVYIQDVRDYTAEWVLSGGDVAAHKRRVSEIAKDDGITDWEKDDATYEAIGRGLKKAGLKGDRYSKTASLLGDSDSQRIQWIQKGYDAEKAP